MLSLQYISSSIVDTIISHRYLEDYSSNSGGRDDDSYNSQYISCSQEIHEELTNFGYIAGSIIWYGLLVGIIHRCCLKVQLDGAPIYDAQYWFITANIQFILICISVLLFFPYPCSVEEAKQKLVDVDCLQHCQQDRYICMAITGMESIIGIYWYCLAYLRYQMAKRIQGTTGMGDPYNESGMTQPQRQPMDNGIFSKLPNTDQDDDDDDDMIEDGLEMTENSEDTWE
jgi:hypothetical protein